MMTPKFRTHQEMQEVYDQLAKLPNGGKPYCITLHSPERYFGFIGSSHTNDPNHYQWPIIFEEWELFLAGSNEKIVFHEGNSRPARGETREEAIRDGADSGTTAWLAQRAGIEFISPEPNLTEEVESLKRDSSFSEQEIMCYYIGRQMSQWLRYDYARGATLDKYIEYTLKRYLDLYKWEGEFTPTIARNLVEAAIGKRLEDGTKSDFLKIDDPYQNPVSSACSRIRDASLFQAIKKAWDEGKDIFCVFGSGHAIVLEPALRELIGS